MAQDMNQVALVGRLAKDPELRSLPSGSSVCELRLAFTTSKKNGQTGAWEDVSNFINVTVWGNQGEACARNLGKGSRVGISGRIEHRTWKAQDGSNREAHGIVANSVQYLSPKGENQNAAQASHSTPPVQSGGGFTPDDDIPF